MPYRTCDHLKEDGVYCNAPALRGRNYCYFHLTIRGRRVKAAQARRRGQVPALNLPFPEDMFAVQISLHEVMQGLAAHTLDPKTAGLLLYSLQQASTNLLQTPDWKGSCQPVEPSKPLLALDFPSFEQQYQVPKGADLDADFASVEDQLAAAEDSSPCHPELGAPSFAPVVGAKGGSEALSNQDGAPDAAALPSATAESQSQKRSRKKPSHRRGARVPLEKELWEHEDKDAPFRAYTSDGRELTPEDAKLWHKRTMQNLQKHFHKLASSGDAA